MKPLEHKDLMQLAARSVQSKIPGCGFILFTFNFNEAGRMNYISNADRKDVIKMLVEFLKKAGTEEDWMKHL